MEENENLYDKLRELYGEGPVNLNILDMQIDVDLQVEYFENSRQLSSEIEESWALEHMDDLFDPQVGQEDKKRLLARLATINRVECFRAIETYQKAPEEDLAAWAFLSLNESRMQLEGSLLGENQILISTGLGGKDDKLRYFVAVIARNRETLNKTQKKVIRNEFNVIVQQHGGEIEQIAFSDYLSTLLLLLPLEHSLSDVFNLAINECNTYGHFLEDHFIVTNVKTLSNQEIKDFIEKKFDSENTYEDGKLD